MVNNTRDDYFYNIFNSIGFSVNESKHSEKIVTISNCRSKFTISMSFPILQLEVQRKSLSILEKKSLSESMPTASVRKGPSWGTVQKSGNVCSPMKTHFTTAGTRKAIAF